MPLHERSSLSRHLPAKHFPTKHLPVKHPPRQPGTGMAGSRIAEAGVVNSTTPSTDIGLLDAHNDPRRGGCFAGKSNSRQAIITGHGREGSSPKKCQTNLSFWKIYLTLPSRFNARQNRAALDDRPQPHFTAGSGTAKDMTNGRARHYTAWKRPTQHKDNNTLTKLGTT